MIGARRKRRMNAQIRFGGGTVCCSRRLTLLAVVVLAFWALLYAAWTQWPTKGGSDLEECRTEKRGMEDKLLKIFQHATELESQLASYGDDQEELKRAFVTKIELTGLKQRFDKLRSRYQVEHEELVELRKSSSAEVPAQTQKKQQVEAAHESEAAKEIKRLQQKVTQLLQEKRILERQLPNATFIDLPGAKAAAVDLGRPIVVKQSPKNPGADGWAEVSSRDAGALSKQLELVEKRRSHISQRNASEVDILRLGLGVDSNAIDDRASKRHGPPGKNYSFFLSAVAIMKCEGSYLKEWLIYHRLIGIEHFFLYNNDPQPLPTSADASLKASAAQACPSYADSEAEPGVVPRAYNLSLTLAPYVASGLVTVIEWKDDRSGANQLGAYAHFLENFRWRSTWAAVLDIDEFIVPTQADVALPALLGGLDDDVGALALHWRMFGSSGYEARPLGSVIASYVQCSGPQEQVNYHVKSIVRLKLVKKISVHDAHLTKGIAIDTSGNVLPKRYATTAVADSPLEFLFRINHYHTRSAEEFKYKIHRGRASIKSRRPVEYYTDIIQRYNTHRDNAAVVFVDRATKSKSGRFGKVAVPKHLQEARAILLFDGRAGLLALPTPTSDSR